METSEQGKDRERGQETGRGSVKGHSAIKIEFEISDDMSTLYWPNYLAEYNNGDASLLEQFKQVLKFLGGYSEDEDQNLRNDDSSMTFLNTKFYPTESKEMSVEMDLNCADEKSKPYTGNWMKSLHNFFSWILNNKTDKSSEIFRSESKIICMENVLTRILNFPSRYRKCKKKFFAVELNGVTYIFYENEQSQVNLQNVLNWGHKFKQFLTLGENVENGVNPNRDYRCVLSSQLGPHKIFFSASIDCVIQDLYKESLTDLSPCVMFKCFYENPKNEKMEHFERVKKYEWCTGLTLTGAPRILVGYRDYHGIVRRLKLFTEEDLARDGKNVWNMNNSITCLEKILSFVKERTHSKPGTIFCFVKPENASYVKCEEDSNVKDFVPSWFTEDFKCSK